MKNSSRLSRLQKVGLVSAGVVTGAVVAATGFASAADNSTTPAPSNQSQQGAPSNGADSNGGVAAPDLGANGRAGQHVDGDGPHGPGMDRPVEEPLTGEAATKVEAAVKAKYADATIERMEKDAHGGAVYEAHIIKADGSHATVLLDADFAITGEQTGGPHGDMGKGGPGGLRPDETAVTGPDAARLTAAAEQAVPGGTVVRVETDGDGAAYEVHMTDSTGAAKTVKFDKDLTVLEVQDGMGAGGPHDGPHDGTHGVHEGPGGPGGDMDGDGPAAPNGSSASSGA